MAKTRKSSTLTSQMMLAIAELAKGGRDELAALTSGVARSTVNSWKLYNPAFIQELRRQTNAISETILAAHTDIMKEMTGFALETISKACKAGDVTVSRWVLDKASTLPQAVSDAYTGITARPAIIPDDVDQIIKEIAERDVEDYLLEQGSDSFEIFQKGELTTRRIKELKAKNNHLYE